MTQQKAAGGNLPESDVLPGNAAPSTRHLWTIEQVAEYLQLTPETVRAMARDGEIPAIKIRNRWRFRRENVENVEAWAQQVEEESVTGGGE